MSIDHPKFAITEWNRRSIEYKYVIGNFISLEVKYAFLVKKCRLWYEYFLYYKVTGTGYIILFYCMFIYVSYQHPSYRHGLLFHLPSHRSVRPAVRPLFTLYSSVRSLASHPSVRPSVRPTVGLFDLLSYFVTYSDEIDCNDV
jgi:hypothetical protein